MCVITLNARQWQSFSRCAGAQPERGRWCSSRQTMRSHVPIATWHDRIVSRSKVLAHRALHIFGVAGLRAAELHGDLTQVQRLAALEQFRDNDVDFLLCTDLASRGLDIADVHNVVNFSFPSKLTTYVHRVGRTARAGKTGHAITLVTDQSRSVLKVGRCYRYQANIVIYPVAGDFIAFVGECEESQAGSCRYPVPCRPDRLNEGKTGRHTEGGAR